MCSKYFKNLLVQKDWSDLKTIRNKCSFGHILPRLFKLFRSVKNIWPPGDGACFPYMYIVQSYCAIVKMFLVKTCSPVRK